MENEKFFSWGPNNIPGRRIEDNPADPIVLYGESKNIRASELCAIQPFIVPTAWRQEAEALVNDLKKPKMRTIVDIKALEQKRKEAVA